MSYRQGVKILALLIMAIGFIFSQLAFSVLTVILPEFAPVLPNPAVVWVVLLAFFVQNVFGAFSVWLIGLLVDCSSARHVVGPYATGYMLLYMLILAVQPAFLKKTLLSMILCAVGGLLLTDLIYDLLVYESWSSGSEIVISILVYRLLIITVLVPLVYALRHIFGDDRGYL
jgi:hypothetical protein